MEKEGVYSIVGLTPIREINRLLSIELPESRSYTTIAGLCFFLAGGVPKVGDVIQAPNGMFLEIEEMKTTIIKKVRLTLNNVQTDGNLAKSGSESAS